MKENEDQMENEEEEEEINTNTNKKEKENKKEEDIKEKNNINEEEDNTKKEENKIEDMKLYDLKEENNEFDENIYFNHYYLAQRVMAIEPKINGRAIPYIMSREFLYSCFEDKKNYKLAKNETYQQILGRVKQFMNSNDDNFNKIFLDNITSYTEILGKEKSETIIIPVLSKIVEDKINTKIYFLKVLESYIEYLYKLGEEGIEIIKNNILNIFEELYRIKFSQNKDNTKNNKNYTISEKEQKEYDSLLFERFIQASKILIKTEYKDYIYNMILDFGKAKKEDNSEILIKKKILSIKLITNLSSDFGEEFINENILPRLDELMQEENIEVIEEICLSFITLIKLLNLEFIGDYIMNSLKKLSGYKFWVIRKKCIEVLYTIIYELKNKYKKEKEKENNEYDKVAEYILKIILLIEKLIDDKKKKVRMFLIEKIGEIIKPLDKNELSEKLFNFYIKTIEEYYNNEDNLINLENKKRINYYFAYNFPAVLFYYTPESWDKLKNVYNYLCADEDINVRSSIINSFYEVSKILGKEKTQNDLLPLYDKFLENEQSSYCKALAEKNLPRILSNLDTDIREKYFNNENLGYKSIISNETSLINKSNQNKKVEYLKNILTYYNLYDNEIIYKKIIPKCIYFSFDPIYKVRSTSSKVLGELILYLYNKNYQKFKLFKLIESYAYNKKFQQRINFVKICQAILFNDNIFYKDKLKQILFTLANKELNFNVLIAMAKTLKKIVTTKNAVCCEDTSIHYLCKKLDMGKSQSIGNIFKNVKLLKNEKLEIVGNIPEGEIFVLDNKYFKDEFGVEIKKKKSNDNIIKKNNIENEDIKYID